MNKLLLSLCMLALLIPSAVRVGAAEAETALPPSLEGEMFLKQIIPVRSPTETATASCSVDANGVIKVHYSGTGVAVGPYPGTFEERGTFTLGAIVNTSTQVREVTDFHATFIIDSPVGQVTGTKTLRTTPSSEPSDFDFPSSGQCLRNEIGPVTQTTEGAVARSFYEARITTSTGTFFDSGESTTASTEFRDSNSVTGSEDVTAYLVEFFLVSNGVVPAITPGHVTGGGQIDHPRPGGNASGVTFGLQASSDATTADGIRANCTVNDHEANVFIKCLDATTFFQVGNTVTFEGDAEVNGSVERYQIEVTDNGEPGIVRDTFHIQTESGYSASGLLTQGNIQVHDVASTP